MEEPKLSVRQWQEQFQSGAFSAPDLYTQCTAGWSDWFCQDHALAGRLKKIGRIVMGVRDPFILDNYYVWFKNNCPLSGPLYDHVTFTPLSVSHDGKGFSVVQDSPHEPYKWTLYTARYGYDSPEFGCRNIREMLLYVNRLGPELQQGFVPAFVQEKAAVAAYAKARGEPAGIRIVRDGGQHYHYISRQDQRRRTVMVASSLEDTPAGFDPGGACAVRGLYVYCPEEARIAALDRRENPQPTHHRKEAAR